MALVLVCGVEFPLALVSPLACDVLLALGSLCALVSASALVSLCALVFPWTLVCAMEWGLHGEMLLLSSGKVEDLVR